MSLQRASRAHELTRLFRSALSRRAASNEAARRREGEPRFNYTSNPFDPELDPDHVYYRKVTARELSRRTSPPKRVKMLVRDFIDDCLYNPHYGYFSTQAYIFDPDKAFENGDIESEHVQSSQDTLLAVSRKKGFDFANFKNTTAFETEVARRYGVLEGSDVSMNHGGPGRQIWHTPTELFKPWYGKALANYIMAQAAQHGDETLVIYEMGAGNGTLMRDILDHIAQTNPDVYARTEYKIIEISERLHNLQRERAAEKDVVGSHSDKVQVVHSSIFDWKQTEERPCFFLAMEVLDNFAHDIVRYTRVDHEPMQCVVAIDGAGDFNEIFEPVTDPWIRKYLETRRAARPPPVNRLMASSATLRKAFSFMPFAANLSLPEFVPTKQLMLLESLKRHFPKHRLLLSDFSTLPDVIPGHNAPVVQTRYKGETVPVTTYLVQPGFFDVFFPTDFDELRNQYMRVMSKDDVEISQHAAFLKQWADLDRTKLQDGSNPMVDDYYENAKFLYAV